MSYVFRGKVIRKINMGSKRLIFVELQGGREECFLFLQTNLGPAWTIANKITPDSSIQVETQTHQVQVPHVGTAYTVTKILEVT